MTESRFGLKLVGCVLGLSAAAALGSPVQAHHVPGEDRSGILLSVEPRPESKSADADGGVQATYSSRADAEAAAQLFGCEGAHQMGSQWMPCAAPEGNHAHH